MQRKVFLSLSMICKPSSVHVGCVSIAVFSVFFKGIPRKMCVFIVVFSISRVENLDKGGFFIALCGL